MPRKSSERPGGRAGEEPLVAVLSRRGRFWSAEPVFAAPRGADGTRGHRPAQIPLGPTLPRPRSEGAGPARAREGDLVLMTLGGPAQGGGGRKHGAPRRGGGGGGAGGRAWIERVIGSPDVARDAIEGLMLDRGLARRFPGALEREARAERDRDRSRERRRDLRELWTFTIDPAQARDFDDAISAEWLDGERVRVWVHIADVSAYVREGSGIDREGRRRGLSVYVPGAVEPMLPEGLSNEACSLVPGEDRLAVTVELDLQEGKVLRRAFHRSVIRSDMRLEYEQVERVFAGVERIGEEGVAKALQAARVAARGLGEGRRGRREALAIESQEPEFVLDEEGNVTRVEVREHTESHELIESLMIAANEAVAEHLQERGIACLYRVHERPEAEGVERLVDQLSSLDIPTPPVPKGMSRSEGSELMGAISRTLERYLRSREAAGSGFGRMGVQGLLLRALKQAHYSPVNLGHAGLGSKCYCHFTSPIRRYPDLVCHRGLLSSLGFEEREGRAGELGELAAWTSEREREGMVLERDADDIARGFALEGLLHEVGWGEVFEGEVTGVIGAGAFLAFGPAESSGEKASGEGAGEKASGEGPGEKASREGPGRVFTGMLPVRLLRERGSDDWWEVNEQGTILEGVPSGARVRLGERLSVRVGRVERLRGRVDLRPGQGQG